MCGMIEDDQEDYDDEETMRDLVENANKKKKVRNLNKVAVEQAYLRELGFPALFANQ